MNRQLYLERRAEFPWELRELADNNPVIADTIQSYAHGSIVFLDEALARIAILLARQLDNQANPPTQEQIAKMPISENKS